ncbi:MAG TPA: sigma-70 family RNA polymerase sigma factor [Tepidisphaeraceae bacterium]|nr:sigma-70 family RNA polymerase sigma factor [Tepidisphaeraceae bacterium]
MDDKQLRRRFYDLVWPQMPVVLRTAQILCGGDVPEAEDLAQETMVKAFGALERFQPGTDVKAWLLTILRHTRIDRLRATAAKPALSLERLEVEPADQRSSSAWDRVDIADDPEAILARFSDREVIQALGRLPEEIRWTLLLVDVEGMSHQEAAELLTVPVGTIKSRAHRGRIMLRESLLPAAKRARILGETDEQQKKDRPDIEGSEIGTSGDSDGYV